jgi:hypothetical protein
MSFFTKEEMCSAFSRLNGYSSQDEHKNPSKGHAWYRQLDKEGSNAIFKTRIEGKK